MPYYKNNPILNKLEFDRIQNMLSDFCSSNAGKNLVKNMYPSTNINNILKWQIETTEIVNMLSVGEQIPLGGISDLHDILKKIRIEQVLEITELLKVERLLYATKNLLDYFNDKVEHFKLDYFFEVINKLTDLSLLRKNINKIIKDDGTIFDHASNKLFEIRSEIATNEKNIRRRLESLIRNTTFSDVFQEHLVTIRGNRLVVPVKVEHKNKIPGIVHDQSSSGSTLYIEPADLVPLNNRISELQQEEKAEIYRLLKDLSLNCTEEYDSLSLNHKQLAYIDFTVAKAKFSISYHGVAPTTLESSTDIYLSRAFHPLLKRENAVPIDLHLDDETKMLIITGPNTGGKTVTLKTVGLLALMHQSGLHIPVHSESRLGIYSKIFVDIGDEQSIEQSLSTFSSHLNNICKILDGVNENSLVLLDEIGSGTDPIEGAALATAILNDLLETKCKVFATTHYSELKHYAYQTDGVENASMEFNTDTLQPTYRLIVGISGESNAFAIAEKIGLKRQIIKNAKQIIIANANELTEKVKNIERLQGQINEERQTLLQERAQLDLDKMRLNEEISELKKNRDKILMDYRKEALQLLESTKKEIQNISEQLRETRKKDQIQASVSLSEAKKRFHQLENLISPSENTNPSQNNKIKGNDLKIGTEVYLHNYHTNGTILSMDKKSNKIEVQAGILKLTVSINEISKATSKDSKNKSSKKNSLSIKRIATEIDLRGLTVEEALHETDRFIDEAYLNNLNQIHIIHGKGTGALRKAIGEMLSSNRFVKEFHFAPHNEGGDGATIAILK